MIGVNRLTLDTEVLCMLGVSAAERAPVRAVNFLAGRQFFGDGGSLAVDPRQNLKGG